MQTNQSNVHHQSIVGLFLTIGIASLPLGAWGEQLRVFGPLLGHEVLWWLAVALLILYVLRVERRPLSSIGFRGLGFADVLIAVLAGILMIIGTRLIFSEVVLRFHLQINVHEFNIWMSDPFWYRFILVLRAAVAEEILVRAYPLERLIELTDSRLLAGTLSWAAFTVLHVRTWGPGYLITAGFYGLILTLLYLWRRNVCSNIIAHWILDAAVYLVR
jgi:membrane protease YdiL (CAAX protease family)